MFRLSELANGVRIVTEAAPSKVVAVGIWIEVGARDEHDLTSGCSHFVEHMLFKGTSRRSAHQIAREFDVMGGMANAFTATEATCVQATVLADRLPQAADLLADIVLAPAFAPAEVENEREVIGQEIAMVEDTPDDLIHDLFNRQLWGRHPLGNPVLGSPRVVGALNPEHLRDFHHRHYIPKRILIAAAGQLEHEQFCKLWQDSFGALTTPVGAGSRATAERQAPRFVEPERRVHDRGLEQLHLMLGTYGPAENDPERYAFHLLNTILGGNMSSRLFQEIREKRGLAYAVFSYLNSHSDSGNFGLYLGVDPLAAEEAAGLAAQEIRRLRREPVTAGELSEARDYARALIMLAEENMEARMSRLARNTITFGREVPLAETLEKLEKVSIDDIMAVAEQTFSRPLSGVALGPLDDELLDWDVIDD
ncbi:MAG: pitrilysin family protein [Desulfurivibrio sp.]|nr:pitrilysin family protein [Desulfurivibrio sp.]